jgi:hypothetical protein
MGFICCAYTLFLGELYVVVHIFNWLCIKSMILSKLVLLCECYFSCIHVLKMSLDTWMF